MTEANVVIVLQLSAQPNDYLYNPAGRAATMSGELSCFKAYDIRGRIPDELNEDLAYRIGRAYAAFLQPRRVAVGTTCA